LLKKHNPRFVTKTP